MSVGIDDTAVINNVIFTDQGSAPATPGAGKTRVFTEANGLYIVDDDGLTIGPFTSSDGWIPSKLTWTWSSGDDPSYVIETNSNVTGTFSGGMRFKITNTTVKFGIVTKVAWSGANTQLTLYCGTDYDLTSGTLTSPYYSSVKAPAGFPLDITKWSVVATDTSDRSQATPAQNTWYNLGAFTISIPIGIWDVDYQALAQLVEATDGQYVIQTTLSTANNSEADKAWTCLGQGYETSELEFPCYRRNPLVLAAKTSYYLNTRTINANIDSIGILNTFSTGIIRAGSAYL